jgi:hypothetical protein
MFGVGTHSVQHTPGTQFQHSLVLESHEPVIGFDLVHATDVASYRLPNHLRNLGQKIDPHITCTGGNAGEQAAKRRLRL